MSGRSFRRNCDNFRLESQKKFKCRDHSDCIVYSSRGNSSTRKSELLSAEVSINKTVNFIDKQFHNGLYCNVID